MYTFITQKLMASRFAERVRAFAVDTRGVTAIEYALIAGLIAVASFVAMQKLGTSLQNLFTTIADKLGSAPGTGG